MNYFLLRNEDRSFCEVVFAEDVTHAVRLGCALPHPKGEVIKRLLEIDRALTVEKCHGTSIGTNHEGVSMTLDEIRREKHIAQQAILDVLHTLKARTGFCPVGIRYEAISCTRIESLGAEYAIGSVEVELQSI